MRHEQGVSGKIDLGARLGPALTACIGVTTRGVRAARLMHKSAEVVTQTTWENPGGFFANGDLCVDNTPELSEKGRRLSWRLPLI
jgi:hypothetical protein